MSSPFDDTTNLLDAPSAPSPAHSPRRFQSAYTPLRNDAPETGYNSRPASPTRFSPAVAFGKRNHASLSAGPNLPYSLPDSAPSSPSRTSRTEWTRLESPKRTGSEVIIIEDETYSQSANFSSSTTSSKRLLPVPQPIFSPQTYAEANQRDDETIKTFQFEDYSGKEFEDYEEKAQTDSIFSAGQETFAYGETYGEAREYPNNPADEEESMFGSSVDNHMMMDLRDYRPSGDTFYKRKVPLKGGHLILENPVPEKLVANLPRTDSEEFTKMLYTACTSGPDDFAALGFTLRAAKYGRETEIVICVTMYNEDEFSFARTMHAVMKNVAHLCSRYKSRLWGKDGWKKVQVIIVSDGRNKISDGVLQLLTAIGVYQDKLTRAYVNEKEVNAHIFEYTTQLSIDENLKIKSSEKNLAPVQVLLCLKEKNQKKINSHRWLFNAFCPVLNPNVVVLLDVGTKPDNHAVYNLWKAFDKDSNIAGAAGEIRTIKGKGWINLLNPLVASQNFEYKMSNILDKPLESVFGYISVLPGALSAYRYIALTNHEDGTGPLASYFRGEDLLSDKKGEVKASSKIKDFFEANMYLAEDRILCWELVAKKDEKWLLKYVRAATGETDVPDSVDEFISQRRRWLNGALFAAMYSQFNFRQIWQTDHSVVRKLFLHIEFLYQFLNSMFSIFSLANFYLTFYFLTGSGGKLLGTAGDVLFKIFNYLLICDLAGIFVMSIGNRPQASKSLFIVGMSILTLCTLYSLICGFYFVIHILTHADELAGSRSVVTTIVVSLLSTYGVYALMSILYLDPWHILTCSLQYFLMIPSYTCTLQIYAFCNTHDVSWGTKGDNGPVSERSTYIIEKNDQGIEVAEVYEFNNDELYEEALYNIRNKRSSLKVKEVVRKQPNSGEDYARDIRTKVVLVWLVVNLVFIMIMMEVFSPDLTETNYYLSFILVSVAFLSFFKALGSLAYLFVEGLRWCVESKSKFFENRGGYSSTAKALNPF
ncbi:glycosyltransferase family 2 protein [Babjeviella inositovora NRRL Y-12698]|uniref:Chitin synthase n=1 Tax=Babjeviella inositovora NRRL Y-12698 TaxID=984486 RepID=A0A1E3QLW9_9ASCO|nr:glycosyltransferase family 2 protein [Babjeviella inositovora NRRL Y-12698]ODQ77977.1 glycosyltransferase family 2 protein [Babjeviella inositovora NRRL Y-12698]